MFTSIQRGLMLVALLALLPLGCGGGDQAKVKDKQARDKQAVAPKNEPLEPEFKFTAEGFSREFIEPKTASSDTKYRNKVVEITGAVAWVRSKDGGKTAEVFLKGDKWDKKNPASSQVLVRPRPEFTKRALELSQGQKVKAVGKYFMVESFAPSLREAALEELSKSETVLISAADLAKDFANSSEAAIKKYAGKDLIVAGEVEELPRRGTRQFAKLKGDGKVSVVFVVSADDAKLLAPGKQARLRGRQGEYVAAFLKNEVGLQDGNVVEVK